MGAFGRCAWRRATCHVAQGARGRPRALPGTGRPRGMGQAPKSCEGPRTALGAPHLWGPGPRTEDGRDDARESRGWGPTPPHRVGTPAPGGRCRWLPLPRHAPRPRERWRVGLPFSCRLTRAGAPASSSPGRSVRGVGVAAGSLEVDMVTQQALHDLLGHVVEADASRAVACPARTSPPLRPDRWPLPAMAGAAGLLLAPAPLIQGRPPNMSRLLPKVTSRSSASGLHLE